MSHRTYLYNVNTPSTADSTDTMMMEWGYEMPLMLQPLLIDGGFIAGNQYNNHVEAENAGLYYLAKPGVENLHRFYNFLEDQPGLIKDIEKFKEARDKLFRYLDRLDGQYFHLDMWDVLNMDDAAHADQAKEWLAHIAHNNEIMTRAMAAADISLLNYRALEDVSPAFMTFSELLNYESYEYGWKCIWEPAEEQLEVEIFAENELWGLRNKKDGVVLNPQFDEFFDFGAHDRAVVSKDGKYGFVDTTGNVVVPLVWEDAFDFEYAGFAMVAAAGKFGIIDLKGNQTTQMSYDELEALGEGNYFTAKINAQWGVIDAFGKKMIDFEHANEVQDAYGFYHVKIEGQKSQKIFNEFFKYLGTFPVDAIAHLEHGLLLVKAHKGVNFNSIYKADGTLLDSGFEKINRQTNFRDLLVIRKNKKHGALSTKNGTYVLPYQYDAILDIGVTAEGHSTDIALIQQADKKGIYDGAPEQLCWLIPLDQYQQIIWLHGTVFALQRNNRWSVANPAWNDFSDFAFDLIVKKPAEDGFAYAFKEEEVYTVSETSIQPTSKATALEHASNDYAYYFEYGSRKRLLAYGMGLNINDSRIDDELSDVFTLFDKGIAAYDAENYAQAIDYYTIASAKDYAPAMNNLAHIYYNVKDFEDDDQAFFWYHKAALKGEENAVNGLGMCYKFGVGTPVDVEKAIIWLKKAAVMQSAIANNNLGDIYSDEAYPFFNLEKALEYYLVAADLGVPKYDWLGYLYELNEDFALALKYHQLGADEGIDLSTFKIGIFHLNGLGTEKNVGLAVDCFVLALDRGYVQAHLELASIFRNEVGFKNESKAKEHIMEAKSAGLAVPKELDIDKKGWFGF